MNQPLYREELAPIFTSPQPWTMESPSQSRNSNNENSNIYSELENFRKQLNSSAYKSHTLQLNQNLIREYNSVEPIWLKAEQLEVKQAISYLKKELKDYKSGESACPFGMAIRYEKLGDISPNELFKASRYYSKALKKYLLQGLELEIANIEVKIGITYHYNKEEEPAIKHYLKALTIFEVARQDLSRNAICASYYIEVLKHQKASREDIARIAEDLGVSFASAGKYRAALQYFAKALEGYTTTPERERVNLYMSKAYQNLHEEESTSFGLKVGEIIQGLNGEDSKEKRNRGNRGSDSNGTPSGSTQSTDREDDRKDFEIGLTPKERQNRNRSIGRLLLDFGEKKINEPSASQIKEGIEKLQKKIEEAKIPLGLENIIYALQDEAFVSRIYKNSSSYQRKVKEKLKERCINLKHIEKWLKDGFKGIGSCKEEREKIEFIKIVLPIISQVPSLESFNEEDATYLKWIFENSQKAKMMLHYLSPITRLELNKMFGELLLDLEKNLTLLESAKSINEEDSLEELARKLKKVSPHLSNNQKMKKLAQELDFHTFIAQGDLIELNEFFGSSEAGELLDKLAKFNPQPTSGILHSAENTEELQTSMVNNLRGERQQSWLTEDFDEDPFVSFQKTFQQEFDVNTNSTDNEQIERMRFNENDILVSPFLNLSSTSAMETEMGDHPSNEDNDEREVIVNECRENYGRKKMVRNKKADLRRKVAEKKGSTRIKGKRSNNQKLEEEYEDEGKNEDLRICKGSKKIGKDLVKEIF